MDIGKIVFYTFLVAIIIGCAIVYGTINCSRCAYKTFTNKRRLNMTVGTTLLATTALLLFLLPPDPTNVITIQIGETPGGVI